MAGGVKVSLAFDDGALVAAPTWTDITEESSRVASFTIDRGRQFELDLTEMGRANVLINDRHGVLDPTNSTGPFYTKIEPLVQAKIELYDPVAAAWSTIFRGYIAEMDYEFNDMAYVQGGQTIGVNQLTLSLVDAFQVLGSIQMQPDGSFGDTVPAASVGNIAFDAAPVNTRMTAVLGNATWPPLLTTIFTGNVDMIQSIYAPETPVLDVLQNAADAEFPGLGNLYVSRTGIVTFHGRKAKFNPVGVAADAGGAWTFTHWKSGDGAAVAASLSDTAQIREFSFNRGISRVINYAAAYPQGIADADRPGQVVPDPVSIGIRGFCTWAREELQIDTGTTTGNNANDECKLFASYYVANYKDPRNRVTNIAFKSMRPTDDRAAANWLLLCGAEISDLIDVTIGSAGSAAPGGGFVAEPSFIEGIHYDVKPLTDTYADVTLRLDLSPQAYFNDGSMFGY